MKPVRAASLALLMVAMLLPVSAPPASAEYAYTKHHEEFPLQHDADATSHSSCSTCTVWTVESDVKLNGSVTYFGVGDTYLGMQVVRCEVRYVSKHWARTDTTWTTNTGVWIVDFGTAWGDSYHETTDAHRITRSAQYDEAYTLLPGESVSVASNTRTAWSHWAAFVEARSEVAHAFTCPTYVYPS